MAHRAKGAAPPNAVPRVKKRGAVKDKLFLAFGGAVELHYASIYSRPIDNNTVVPN